MPIRTITSALILGTVLMLNSAYSQSNDPAWLDDLTKQMLDDEGCIVDLFVNIDEGTLGSGKYYEARVQCRDGRLFDASRVDPEKVFTIKTCEIAVC